MSRRSGLSCMYMLRAKRGFVRSVTQKLYRAKIVPAGTIFATKIVPGGTILVAKSVPALPKVYRPGCEKGPLAI